VSEKDRGLLDDSSCSSGFHMAEAAAGVFGLDRVPLQVGVHRQQGGYVVVPEELPTWRE
jgi:hypothetical protein